MALNVEDDPKAAKAVGPRREYTAAEATEIEYPRIIPPLIYSQAEIEKAHALMRKIHEGEVKVRFISQPLPPVCSLLYRKAWLPSAFLRPIMRLEACEPR